MSQRQINQQFSSSRCAQPAAKGLGIFSLALGGAEVIAPRAVAASCGVSVPPNILRMHGLREIVAGVGLLTARRAAPWLWARVAGDVVDLATLAAGARWRNTDALARTGAATACVATVLAVDVCVARAHRPDLAPDHVRPAVIAAGAAMLLVAAAALLGSKRH